MFDAATRARDHARADLAACRALLRTGSRTFHLASLVLPREVREPASALYAFCRVADDAVDGGGGAAALAEQRQRLHRAYSGRPYATPIDRALAQVVRAYSIPRELPESLLEGFAWDAQGRRYADLPALYAYAARVAGSVGAMMALLMGVRDAARVARAVDLGVAMQLSNIARDVGEDARAGRLYLPLDWLAEAGVEPEGFLRAPAHTPALGAVIARLLEAAEALYARAASGVRALPPSCRPGIGAARLLYAEIGREVARRQFNSVSRRAVVGAGRKLATLAQALAASLASGEAEAMPPLAETRFLVEAVLAGPPPPRRPAPVRNTSLDEHVAWIVDLFTQLDERRAGLVPAGLVPAGLVPAGLVPVGLLPASLVDGLAESS